MTENEANKKECRAPGVTVRKDDDGYIEWPYCSGSGCMHWVWDDEREKDGWGNNKVKQGHCGLTNEQH